MDRQTDRHSQGVRSMDLHIFSTVNPTSFKLLKFSISNLYLKWYLLGFLFQILAANKGDIPGSIQFTPTPTIFGGTISCDPEIQCLKPFEVKSFIISFSSSRTGSFVEDLFFKIVKSGEDIKIMIK